LLIKINKNP